MSTTPNIVALIPARAGSKGVHNKNLQPIHGVPLIALTIYASLKTKYKVTSYVSSDSDEILAIAKTFGANALKRPAALAQDLSSTNEVIEHFIHTQGIADETIIALLQPTSPLRNAAHLDEAIELYLSNSCDAVFSGKILDHSPFKTFVIKSNGTLEPLMGEKYLYAPRQTLPDVFAPNGAIYLFTCKKFKEKNLIPFGQVLPFIMTHKESLDIDTLDDLKIAEACISEKELDKFALDD